MTGYYPIMLKLERQRIAVIGGGSIAARKVNGLLASGASSIQVIAPHLCEELQRLLESGRIGWVAKHAELDTLRDYTLVFAATSDVQLNARISIEAMKYDILVCNVSDGQQGSFLTPAVARHGELITAVSSAGVSPSLARHMKQELESNFLPKYEKALRLMKQLREKVLQSKLTEQQRQRLLRLAANEASDVEEAQVEQWAAALLDRIVLDEGEDTEDGS